MDDLQLALGQHPIGEPLVLTILRAGQRLEVVTHPGELPEEA
jgi:S1-C subfamily serine protease